MIERYSRNEVQGIAEQNTTNKVIAKDKRGQE
jgi:hypothetical protein